MEESRFTIAVVGLGLMGGSFAYALNGFKNCEIIGYDIDSDVLQSALLCGAVKKAASSIAEAVKAAELVIFCMPPVAIIDAIKSNIANFRDGAVVTEICGVKKEIYNALLPIIPDNINFVGIHPMAGKERGGFDNADGSLFKGCGFIIVEHEGACPNAVTLMEELAAHVGAARICVNTPELHDNIIAYTSDLMHISAASLCVDFPQSMTLAHTAGAFRDCTRIATIDAGLWTELLFENSENIIPYLGEYISDLTEFYKALKNGDRTFVYNFLEKACANKRDILER